MLGLSAWSHWYVTRSADCGSSHRLHRKRALTARISEHAYHSTHITARISQHASFSFGEWQKQGDAWWVAVDDVLDVERYLQRHLHADDRLRDAGAAVVCAEDAATVTPGDSAPPPKAESPASVAFPPPPPGVVSGSPAGSMDGKGTGKGDANAVKGSFVVCGTWGSEGKRFKMESIREWDDQEAEEGHWLHTCAQCIMTREDPRRSKPRKPGSRKPRVPLPQCFLNACRTLPNFSASITCTLDAPRFFRAIPRTTRG